MKLSVDQRDPDVLFFLHIQVRCWDIIAGLDILKWSQPAWSFIDMIWTSLWFCILLAKKITLKPLKYQWYQWYCLCTRISAKSFVNLIYLIIFIFRSQHFSDRYSCSTIFLQYFNFPKKMYDVWFTQQYTMYLHITIVL